MHQIQPRTSCAYVAHSALGFFAVGQLAVKNEKKKPKLTFSSRRTVLRRKIRAGALRLQSSPDISTGDMHQMLSHIVHLYGTCRLQTIIDLLSAMCDEYVHDHYNISAANNDILPLLS